jgi:hypothetical protein
MKKFLYTTLGGKKASKFWNTMTIITLGLLLIAYV